MKYFGLFEKVGDEIMSRNLSEFNPQNIAMVHAFPKAGAQHPRLFLRIGDHIAQRDLNTFSSQSLANIVWAFATVNATILDGIIG
jgi:hypothetical protein